MDKEDLESSRRILYNFVWKRKKPIALVDVFRVHVTAFYRTVPFFSVFLHSFMSKTDDFDYSKWT